MKAKKIAAVLLAVLLMVSVFAACGQTSSENESSAEEKSSAGDTSSTESDTESSGESTAEDDLMTPYGKYPELIEIHTAKRASAAPNFVEGEDAENNAMTRYVQDKLNVKVIVDWEVEAAEFANKLSLMLASNDLPDMFSLGTENYLLYRQLVDNEMLADLSEAYEKCAGDYIKTCFETYDNKNLEAFTEDDGALYAIAAGRYGYEHNQLWLRQDWLDKAGITELPETIEDIENILTTWKENPPVEGYVGMSLNATDIVGGYGAILTADPIFNSFGAAPKTWVRDANGEIVYGSVMPEMKEGLAVLADWYAKGLIDQQFATRTSAGATDALFTGSQSGAAFVPWWYCYNIADLPINDPEAKVVQVNAPLDAEGNFNIEWPGPAGNYVMINKDYEYPEAIVKIMNCEWDMWYELDPEGGELIKPNRDANVDWAYMFPDGGVSIVLGDCIPEVGELTTNWIEEGKMECGSLNEELPFNQTWAKSAKSYADTGVIEGSNWVDYTGKYQASKPELMYADNIKKIEPVFSFTTESMADLKPNLDTLESTTFLKIVMGELPVDAFDQFVEDWYAQGGQTMTDEVKAMVEG